MKKLLIFLGILLLIPGCSSSNNKQNNSQTSNSDESSIVVDDKTRTYSLGSGKIWEHFSCSASWSSNRTTNYNVTPYITTYTTDLTIYLNQLRSGFVTYSGSISIQFKFDWTYTVYDSNTSSYLDTTNSTTVNTTFTIEEYLQRFASKKYTFTTFHKTNDSEYQVYSEIPYNETGHTPVISKKDIFSCDVTATYYDYGISGDRNLCYISYEISIANYTHYLKVEQQSSGTYIYPIDSNDLFDYRISLTIGGQKITIRRDGYYYFNKTLDDKTITAISGYIDAYPGRII